MYRQLIIVLGVALIATALYIILSLPEETPVPSAVTSFEECVAEGNPVMESYPRQCRSQAGQLFVEVIEEVPEREISGSGKYEDMIQVISPRASAVVQSPLTITGSARGGWYFEATFPVTIVNWDGLIIAETYAEAQSDWMTADYVPFVSTVTFEKPYDDSADVPEFMKWGAVILQKSNASGLPEHDAAIEIPIRFE